jgi:two-component system alkaline phosphatase synthesis response regulator PhoP
MSKGSILIVEDEENLGLTLRNYLRGKNFTVEWAKNAKESRAYFLSTLFPNIILMDKNLPDGDGFDLAIEFRKQRKDFVLLFVSALNDPQIRLSGLEIGADDYITKPFELKELTLRLEKILSQQNQMQKDEILIEDLVFWPKKFEAKDAQGEIMTFSLKETRLIDLLLSKPGIVLSRDEIIDYVWNEDSFPSNRTIDNMIVKIRKWAESSNQIQIISIRGVGYKWEIKK